MGGENGKNLEENICGRGVGKMLGGGYLWELTIWGTHGVRPYGDKG